VERDVQTTDEGKMIRVYEHTKSGETFLVPDPRLQLDKLEEVQQEVIDMLGGGSQGEEAPGDQVQNNEEAENLPNDNSSNNQSINN
jgi:hypothetical protein